LRVSETASTDSGKGLDEYVFEARKIQDRRSGMTTKPSTWFGVYTASGNLVDVTPGRFHAREIADSLTKEKRVKHVVLPVIITALAA
jgi:hypothetical protein